MTKEDRLRLVWRRMIDRCYNENDPAYPRYGERGITVCKAWRDSFAEFYSWCLANGSKKGLELDRRNNDGRYSPKNCQFVTRKVNANNRECTVFVAYKGKRLSLAYAVIEAGNVVTYAIAARRLILGWSVEDSIELPVAKIIKLSIKGRKFGDLTAIKDVGNYKWLCQCTCGNSKEVRIYDLRDGNTRSCGCLQGERKERAS